MITLGWIFGAFFNTCSHSENIQILPESDTDVSVKKNYNSFPNTVKVFGEESDIFRSYVPTTILDKKLSANGSEVCILFPGTFLESRTLPVRKGITIWRATLRRNGRAMDLIM